MSSAPNAPILPQKFGRYSDVQPLGKGGMGAVYRARDTRLNREVVLKVCLRTDNPEAMERFRREATAAASLAHTNLCPIHDFDVQDGIAYLAMGYIEGPTLDAWVAQRGRLSQREAALMVAKLALAMQAAHEGGVVHRDLKPANIVINKKGEPVILDFGLARQMDDPHTRITQVGAIYGTPSYMAPEQAGGDPETVGPAADVYSLGIILYELLTGVVPFTGPPMIMVYNHVNTLPVPPSQRNPMLDLALEAICLKALAKQPKNRQSSMKELAKALAKAGRAAPSRAGIPISRPQSVADATAATRSDKSREPTQPEQLISLPPLPNRRDDRRANWVTLLIVFVLLSLLGVGVYWYAFHSGRERQNTSTFDIGEKSVGTEVDPEPYLQLRFHEGHKEGMPQEVAEIFKNPTMRFGLVMVRSTEGDHAKNSEQGKKLTFSEWGLSNSTVIRVEKGDKAEEFRFGGTSDPKYPSRGQWVEQVQPIKDVNGRKVDGMISSWRLEGTKILVIQRVEIVPSDPPPGEKKRRLDTCLIRYELKNEETEGEQKVGIRFLLDTFIGARDDVPFIVPGKPPCTTNEMFPKPDLVPDFIQVQEEDDLKKPGTVARIQFRNVRDQLEAPTRVLLGGYPHVVLQKAGYRDALGPLTLWNVPSLSMEKRDIRVGNTLYKFEADSAVVLYWDPMPLKAGETRTVGFSYGLGKIASEGGHIQLIPPGRSAPDAEFTLTAQVNKPAVGESLTLELPPGLVLTEGEEKQTIPQVEAKASQPVINVTWKLKAKSVGEYKLIVRSSKGEQEATTVKIKPRGVFD